MKVGEIARYGAGAVLAIALLAWVLRGQDPAELAAAASSASIGGLLLAGAINLAHVVFRVAPAAVPFSAWDR